MKGKSVLVLLILGVIFIPMAFGTNIIDILQGRQFSTVDGQTCEKKVAEPLMGTVKCSSLPDETNYHEDWEHTRDSWYLGHEFTIRDTCGIDENTPDCEYSLDTSSTSLMELEYKECTSGSCGDWTKMGSQGSNKVIDFGRFEAGDGIVVRGTKFPYNDDSQDWVFKEEFTPYGLESYEPTWGQQWMSKSTCDFDYIDKDKLPEDYDDTKISENMLMYGNSLNYRVSWNTLPYDLAIDEHPQEGEVWCGGNRMYELTKLDTAAGNCYWTVGSFIKEAERGTNFECCPGMTTQTETCSDDFQWVEEEGSECDTSLDCPGNGDWIVDESDSTRETVEKYICDNGKCEVEDSKQVECTYDGQCGEGLLCEDYECVEGEGESEPCDNVADDYCPPGCPEDPDCTAVCGNGECESPPETEETCPSDCAEPPWWKRFTGAQVWGRLLLGLVGGILSFLSLGKITGNITNDQRISLGIPAVAAIVMFALAFTGFWAFALILTIVWGIVEFVI